MSAERDLARLLSRASRRLALAVAARSAGWLSLAALLGVQVGLALRGLHPTASTVAMTLAAALGAGAGIVLLTRSRPKTALVAEVLDVRLGRGAILASAAEALDAPDSRFTPSVLRAAASAVEGVSLAKLLPLRPPPALLFASVATLLLPFALPSGGPAQAQATESGLASLLDPAALQSGDGGAGDAATVSDAPDGAPLVPVLTPDSAATDPVPALPLDVLQHLRERLKALMAELPPSGASGGDAHSAESPSDREALEEALASGDAARILRELERAAADAKAGDRAAALRLEELADAISPPGDGRGDGASETVPPTEGADGSDLSSGGRGLPALPQRLRDACQRYFSSSAD